MSVASVTLPPLVQGPVRGALIVSLGCVRWSEAAPEHVRRHRGALAARLAWWGDDSGGELLPLPATSGSTRTGSGGTGQQEVATLSFQLCTGPKYITRYLRDMGCLTISIEAAGAGRAAPISSRSDGNGANPAATHLTAAPTATHIVPVASVAVGLLALDVQAPISGSYPLVLPGQAAAGIPTAAAAPTSSSSIIGTISVRLQLDYSSGGGGAMLSSFELNEHLASGTGAAGTAREGESSGADGAPLLGQDRMHEAAAAGALPVLGAPSVCIELSAAVKDRWGPVEY